MSRICMLLVLSFILTTPTTLPTAEAQTYTQLYSFTGGADGGDLVIARLARDAKGNLYGTASAGGDLTCGGGQGCGVVFKLSVAGSLTVVHKFTGGTQGNGPDGLLRDGKGNLFGVAYDGNFGLVFKVDKAGKYAVLYSFAGGAEGDRPERSLVQDAGGNLYGVTFTGGNYDPSCYDQGCGTVFELDPTGNHTVLYSFKNSLDGSGPLSVIRDGVGNLYGITQEGGSTGCGGVGCGTIFKLDKTGKKTVLHSFTDGTDGGFGNLDYFGSLVQDSVGNLYGTTPAGGDLSCPDGSGQGCGVVFKIDKKGNETVCIRLPAGRTGAISSSAWFGIKLGISMEQPEAALIIAEQYSNLTPQVI